MPSLHEVLVAIGARPHESEEGALALDAEALSLESLFGGPLAGDVVIMPQSDESIAFVSPPELAACGTLWLPDVGDADSRAER